MNRCLLIPALSILLPGCLVNPPVEESPSDPNAPTMQTFYADADGDGFGDIASPVTAEALMPGLVADASDCDDANADVHPDAAEICDELDNDCDGDDVAPQMVSYIDENGAFVDITADVPTTGALGTGADADLLLCEGTWSFELLVDHQLSITGRGEVVLDGEESHKIATISEDASLTLVNVEVTEAGAEGLLCEDGALTVIDSVLSEFKGSTVIHGNDCEVRIENSELIENEVADVLVADESEVTFVGSRLADNVNEYTTIWATGDSTVSLQSTILDGNSGGNAAIDLTGGHLNCSDGLGFGAGIRGDRNTNTISVSTSDSTLGWLGCDAEDNNAQVQYWNSNWEWRQVTLDGEDRDILCNEHFDGGTECASL